VAPVRLCFGLRRFKYCLFARCNGCRARELLACCWGCGGVLELLLLLLLPLLLLLLLLLPHRRYVLLPPLVPHESHTLNQIISCHSVAHFCRFFFIYRTQKSCHLDVLRRRRLSIPIPFAVVAT
jgi:hypothetical protein